MRGWNLFLRSIAQPPKEQRDSGNAARGLFDRALQIDPNDADALAGSAGAYFQAYFLGWGDPGTDYEAKVLGQANRAIALAPDSVRAYRIKADYLSLSRRFDEALGVTDAGLAINPNDVLLLEPRTTAERISQGDRRRPSCFPCLFEPGRRLRASGQDG